MMLFGYLFYWISWMLWIVVTFFMKKNKQRTFFLYGILILITCSNHYISLGDYQFSLAYVILFIACLLIYTLFKGQIYHLFKAFIIMIGYSSILIWNSSAPIWIFIHELILIPVFCCLLMIMLTTGAYKRLMIGIIGMSFGELFYVLILSSYDLNKTIGDLNFFDHLFVTLLLFIGFQAVQQGMYKLYTLVEAYKHGQSKYYNDEQVKKLP